MTLDEFSKYSKVKKETILMNILDINGVQLINGEMSFSSGTRYPCKKGLRIKEPQDKYYAVLYAVGNERYIDSSYVDVSPAEFAAMLEEMNRLGYIEPIAVENTAGANGYKITLNGSEKLHENKSNFLKELALIAGTFVGTASAAYNNMS